MQIYCRKCNLQNTLQAMDVAVAVAVAVIDKATLTSTATLTAILSILLLFGVDFRILMNVMLGPQVRCQL